ncbi:hypothetical protein [Aliikangiella maris]|uniref:Uncharacterized protein n=2 Tax=Aliikangiella maris TaxID=3162458 RepID=A0ABV3MKW8_9GAMM
MALKKRTIKLTAIGDPPSVKCSLCSVEHKPVVLNLTPTEFLRAVHHMGWREVETCDVLFEMLCGDCISELEDKNNSCSKGVIHFRNKKRTFN